MVTQQVLRENLPALRKEFQELIPKLTNRAIYKPEFDLVVIQDPIPNSDVKDTIATVCVVMIETILKPMTFTLRYHVGKSGFVWPVEDKYRIAQVYKYPIEKWIDSLRVS